MNFVIVLFSSLFQAIFVNMAAKFFQGRSSYFRALILTLLGTFASSAIYAYLNEWAGLVSFILLIAIYKIGFEIGWLSALLVWLLSILLFILFMFLAAVLLGISLFMF